MSFAYWVGFVLLCIVPTITICTKMYYRRQKGRPFDIWQLTWYVLVCVSLSTLTYNLIYGSFSRISRVDASPIAQLNSEQVIGAPEILVQLAQENYYGHFLRLPHHYFWYNADVRSPQEHISLQFRMCGTHFSRRHTGESLLIHIHFHPDESQALYRFHDEPSLTINDNGAKIILDNPFDTRHFSRFDWRLSSLIFFGNTYISITEHRNRHNLHDDMTSIFIEWLVEEIINWEASIND